MTDPCLSLTETQEKVKDMPGVASVYCGIVNQSKSRMAKYTKDEEVDDFWKLIKLVYSVHTYIHGLIPLYASQQIRRTR